MFVFLQKDINFLDLYTLNMYISNNSLVLLANFKLISYNLIMKNKIAHSDSYPISKYHYDKSYFSIASKHGNTDLVQIGRLICTPNTIINEHIHGNFYELTVVNSGEGISITNGIPTTIKSGDIYFSFPCDAHKIVSDNKNPLSYDYFAFNTNNIEFHDQLEKITQTRFNPSTRVFTDDKIHNLVGYALSEIDNNNPFHEDTIEHIFELIIIYFIRDVNNQNISTNIEQTDNNKIMCYQIMNYIDTHILTIKSLEEIACFLNYNYSYLSAIFKNYTSMTIWEYYQNKRLGMSKIMIQQQKMKISKVAEILNYSSQYAFSKAFKNKFGISPNHLYKEKI